MDRADVLSGAAFKAVLRAALVFVLVLAAMTVFSIRLIDKAMTEQVRARVVEMERSISGISDDQTPSTIAELVAQVTRGSAGQTLAYAVFDASGLRLAGNTSIRPEHGTWVEVPYTLELPAHLGDDATERVFLMHAVTINGMTLVVGRSTEHIVAAKREALRGFALTGFVVVLATLGIGYALSSRSQRALEDMEAVLDRVSRGETTARIAAAGGNDQIDRIARRMNEHLDQLDALFQQTRRTSASVAHDLRRPLARATIGMERALARAEAGEDASTEIGKALADLSHLQSVIASILRIARIESGDVAEMQPLDLRDVLDEVAETFVPVAEDAGQRLVYGRADGPLSVMGDAEMLAQLVVNLVQNAITHAGAGATITLAGRDVPEGIEIAVSDTGQGIPAEMRAKVLEPFFQADAARTGEGSGLGLPLVKAIADRHGGTLSLEDAAPGLRVRAVLPRLTAS
jgi:signal transduction histidine kinase